MTFELIGIKVHTIMLFGLHYRLTPTYIFFRQISRLKMISCESERGLNKTLTMKGDGFKSKLAKQKKNLSKSKRKEKKIRHIQ